MWERRGAGYYKRAWVCTWTRWGPAARYWRHESEPSSRASGKTGDLEGESELVMRPALASICSGDNACAGTWVDSCEASGGTGVAAGWIAKGVAEAGIPAVGVAGCVGEGFVEVAIADPNGILNNLWCQLVRDLPGSQSQGGESAAICEGEG